MNKIIYGFDTILDHIRWKIEDLEIEESQLLDDDISDWLDFNENGIQLQVLRKILKIAEEDDLNVTKQITPDDTYNAKEDFGRLNNE